MECRVDMPEVLSLPSTNGRKRSGASVSFGIGRGEELRLRKYLRLFRLHLFGNMDPLTLFKKSTTQYSLQEQGS